MMINEFKFKEEIENSESEVYYSDSVPLKQDVVDSMMAYWKRIYQNLNNDTKINWILEEKSNYVKKIREKEESVMATMLREWYGREQFITIGLLEHFDMLNADLRMENQKIKMNCNFQDIATKFHLDLPEHMDVLKVKIKPKCQTQRNI